MRNNLHPNLQFLKEFIYDKCSFELAKLIHEKEGQEYEACRFKLNDLKVISRKAKITPAKIGQFVTLWKRSRKGPIEPIHYTDDFALIIINTHSPNKVGQFIFNKDILIKNGILTTGEKEGKRGFRVYPPWDIPTSKQGMKTQKWQLNYFLTIDTDRSIDLVKIKKLYFNQ
jgi:hypothetical protein